VGIEASGDDEVRALENATLGLFSLMVRGGVSARVERTIRVEAHSNEDLLVDWLSEVIATASTRAEVYCEVDIESTGAHAVSGVIRGEAIDASRHELRFDVKAATYHRLAFERGGGGCRVRVIFDL